MVKKRKKLPKHNQTALCDDEMGFWLLKVLLLK